MLIPTAYLRNERSHESEGVLAGASATSGKRMTIKDQRTTDNEQRTADSGQRISEQRISD
jgi:hypothetical protein